MSVGEEADEDFVGEEAAAGGETEAAVLAFEEAEGGEFGEGGAIGGFEGRGEAALECGDVQALVKAESEDRSVGLRGLGGLWFDE